MTVITILRAGPLTTLQDAGRFGMLRHGVSASGPMDRGAFARAGAALPRAGATGIEFTQGLAFETDGPLTIATPDVRVLGAGERVDLPPAAGNYGYVRFDREIDIAPVLGSRSTNVTVGLGGYEGRALRAGDRIGFGEEGSPPVPAVLAGGEGPLRVVWGLHAELFEPALRARFETATFRVTTSLDRMGVRLDDPDGLFRDQARLTLVSDAIVPGDIQILGDGTPIVLMRDHQPTGGYPRIATIVSADLDRFAQMRPDTALSFLPVRP
ncbi:MAG: urea amidolyase [Devosia sp.]|uniref:5-oxoprolinase subunit C family protein n=1 Tax=Devosia sp. TaxID=1871048 RepID=UPI001A3ED659|nr:urea amidolyase [Devosia sp.]MBL8597874.1 urea amidolyase [Devosia sp.]